MSAFLSRLVARSRTPIGTLRPRARPSFEPWPRPASFPDADTDVQAIEVERIAPQVPTAITPTIPDAGAGAAVRPARAATHADRPRPTRSGPPQSETGHRSASAAPGDQPRVPTGPGEAAGSSRPDPGLLDPSPDGPSPAERTSGGIGDVDFAGGTSSRRAHAPAPRGAPAESRPPETPRPDGGVADEATSRTGGRPRAPAARHPRPGPVSDPAGDATELPSRPVRPGRPVPPVSPEPAVDARPLTTATTPAVATTIAATDDAPPAPDVTASSPAPVSSEAPPLPEAIERHTPRVVNVTIGRVEVRAVQAPAPRRQPERPAPTVSLDDYLRRQGSG